jgi:hypothetical protein
MPKYARSSRSRPLNTVAVGPVTMARAVLRSLVSNTRSTIRVVQQISSMVQSVELVNDRLEVSTTPEAVRPGPVVYLPMGKENVALQGDFSVTQTKHSVVISVKLNAYLLNSAASNSLGSLVSRMAGHLNTQVRIKLRETIDVEVIHPPVPPSRRLTKKKTTE